MGGQDASQEEFALKAQRVRPLVPSVSSTMLTTAAPSPTLRGQKRRGGRIKKLYSHSLTAVAASISALISVAALGISWSPNSVGAATASVSASKYPSIPAGPIKLGVSLPLSGAAAAYGTLAEKALEDVSLKAFDAANPDGIDGHQVQFVILDDASDPTKAVSVANQFVSDKVAAVVALSYNTAADPLQLAILSKAKIPVIAVVSSDEFANTSKYPYFYGTTASNKDDGEAAEIGSLTTKRSREWRYSPTIRMQWTSFRTNLSASLKSREHDVTIKSVSMAPGSVDVSTQIAELKAWPPIC